jgi:hypothetical protein
MSEQEIEYDQLIQNSYRQNKRTSGWAKLRIHLLIGISLLILSGAAYWLYYYGQEQPTDIKILVGGCFGILAILSAFQAWNSLESFQHSQRNGAEDLLHLDLYQSNKDALLTVIEKATSDIRRGQSKADSLAALLEETKAVSARYARLHGEWSEQHADVKLADYIYELIQTALQNQAVESDLNEVAVFLDMHEPVLEPDETNVTRLPDLRK